MARVSAAQFLLDYLIALSSSSVPIKNSLAWVINCVIKLFLAFFFRTHSVGMQKVGFIFRPNCVSVGLIM